MATNQPKPIPQLTEAEIARFWSKVDKSGGPDACWPWTGATHGRGYGNMNLRGRTFSAIRIAMAICGTTPDGFHVLHSCDFPACCNPYHLSLGTAADNNRDRDAKGRTCKGDRHWSRIHTEKVKRGEEHRSRTHPESVARGDRNGARTRPDRAPKGERVGTSKLTASQVLEIRRRVAGGERGYGRIAMEYGISEHSVSGIVRRVSWRHLSPEEAPPQERRTN